MFLTLVIILVVFVIAFVTFLTITRKMTSETFVNFCKKKVTTISRRKNLYAIANLNIQTLDNERLNVNHVIFGRKYIYLISDFMLKGFVSGEACDNSWVYYNNVKKSNHYLRNLNKFSDKNIRDFSGILNISSDLIVSICLVPNECDFKIENAESDKKLIVHYSSLGRKIDEFEQQNIGSLDQEQIYEQFKAIKSQNNEERR